MAAQKKKAQDEYGAASITILEGLEVSPQTSWHVHWLDR